MITKVPYTTEGWLDWEVVDKVTRGIPFVVVIGGRQVGKTYGRLLIDEKKSDECIMWVRREQKERLAMQNYETKSNPFSADGLPHGCGFIKNGINCTYFYETKESEKPFAVCYALADIGGMRGISYEWCNEIVFDEFIGLATSRKTKGEETAFLDLYETVSGNRELNGREPVKAYLLANANDIGSPVLSGMGLTGTVLNMMKNDKDVYISPQRGVAVFIIKDSPISSQRAKTALHKLVGRSRYSKMSIGNDFTFNSFDGIRTQNFKEYYTVACVGQITFMRHKSKNRWYIVSKQLPSPKYFPGNKSGKKEALRYLSRFKWPFLLIDGETVFFDTYESKRCYQEIVGFSEK